jgi:hypothetical protein
MQLALKLTPNLRSLNCVFLFFELCMHVCTIQDRGAEINDAFTEDAADNHSLTRMEAALLRQEQVDTVLITHITHYRHAHPTHMLF